MDPTNFLLVVMGVSMLGITACLTLLVIRTLYHVETSRKASTTFEMAALQGIERLSEKQMSDLAVRLHSGERIETNGEKPKPTDPFMHIPMSDLGEPLKDDPVMEYTARRD